MAVEIKADAVKALREETGAGIMDCKRALQESQGDMEQAKAYLRQRGFEVAAKKSSREANQGIVESYIHGGGRIGVLLELNCETDFVARNADFQWLARELAMQIAAMNPRWASPEDATAEDRTQEQLSDEQIKGLSLLSQPYIRDQSRTIDQLITETIAKTGENIRLRRFTRYELGK
ncbi:MAG TPA: translation elongation factor Ts [Chloroflexota bacterium]|nr:translation elongation factor Ts [Chloroflexota bacterium]